MAESETTPPTAMVVHAIAGRTRLRVPERRHQADYFDAVSLRLTEHPKVRRVRANPGTASILLEHEGSIEDFAADLRDLLPIAFLSARPLAGRGAMRRVELTPAAAAQMLAAGCILLGVWQLRRGRLFGTASEQMWNAVNAWRNFRSPAMTLALLGGGLVRLVRGPVLSSASSLVYYAMNLRRP